MKKILGSAIFLVILVAGWLIYQGGLVQRLASPSSSSSSTQTSSSDNSNSSGNGNNNSNSGSSSNNSSSNASTNVVQSVAVDGFVPNKNTLKSIVTNGVVRISVENPSRPFYSEDGGKPQGFNVDFAKLLFAQKEFTSGDHSTIKVDTGHGVDTYPAVPAQLTQTDKDGNATVDIAMDGLTFSDDTPNGVVYTVPYIDDFGYALIVRKGSSIHSTADLAGKKIGILQGDPDVKAFVTKAFPSNQVVELSDASINGERSWMAHFLNNGQVDAIVYDYPFGVAEIEGTDLTFAVSKLEGSNLAYKIGVRKSDNDLLVYLNSAIAKVRQSPEYLDLLRKYFISNQIATTAAQGNEKTYIVKSGDTLNLIASSQLGSSARYVEIQRRNNLPNPNLILVGQRLVIPRG